ncbi:BTB/POZ domain-containing protein 6-like isoform X2 [Toxorhynchites rutilus septentrionalis]|uniref:BTB/POZ domain-containing protein 6-like isoform X2 n=1 Tax=Toxorhynchites rutilus septentrionalis TaxID=329112 RepID=UPI0024784E1F|nr:BTB/POZ domain-containing protein 6-like isoform X2 [Toxorhynchites rutilus septentrionalis]
MANQGQGDPVLGYNGSATDRKEGLVNNEFMSDVVFLVGEKGQRIHAHKLFLIAASEYFYVMFNGNFRESVANEIVLEDIEPAIFLEIMRFVYCGKIVLTFENIHEIYIHSRKYMLMELLNMASDFLEKNIEPDNALKIFTQNRFYGFQFVDEKCLRMISNNPLYFFNHEDFATIDRESLSLILGSKKINCTDDQLLGAMDIWEKTHEKESVDELRAVIKNAKRSYDCYKLRMFGPSSSSEPSDFGFSITSETTVNMYGIGVYIKSCAAVISVELKIWENDIEIGCDLFEYENENFLTVDVANLFFEQIVLKPHHRYRISLNITPAVEPFTIQNPKMHHDRIKMSIANVVYGRCDSMFCAIAHLHCKERQHKAIKQNT